MSCGFTTSATVSARAAASTFASTSTPYFSRSSTARSGRFSPTIRSAMSWPPRMRPESRDSPITPAPMIATVMAVLLSGGLSCGYFWEMSERRKNVRFWGRSASLLIR